MNNIKLAAFAGLLTGIFHGLIDIIARLSAWSFEWFEFYQTLLLSITAFTIGFIILGIIAEIVVMPYVAFVAVQKNQYLIKV